MDQLHQTVDFLKTRGINDAEVGIVLGTGLGNLVTKIEVEKEFSYNVIPNFPIATVEYHFGKLIYGTLGGKKVIALQGRYHFYEGYDMRQIVFPVRVMKLLGVSRILMSNAAGAVNLNMKKGSLMLIDDHINLQMDNPLRGSNVDELGARFPDMSAPYDPHMNQLLKESAKELELDLHEGVYASVPGPNLETRAEYRYLKVIGADAVGMSTVPEVIACNHMGVPCSVISVLTDECDPDNLQPVNSDEIIEIAKTTELKLTKLFCRVLEKL